MHELGMCEAVIDTVERRAQGRRVRQVRLRVGTLHRVVPEAFEQAFEMASMGSVAHGASVDLVVMPVRAACVSCGVESQSNDVVTVCPTCGSIEVEIVGGDELMLESLEYMAEGEERPRDELVLENEDQTYQHHAHEDAERG
jgi:hydrogenase nickel incorporation protein HypA/HybF